MMTLKNADTLRDQAAPPLATDAWLSVVRAYNHCAAALTARAAARGFTLLQHEILINMLRHPDSTQQDLANRCFSAKSGIAS